MELGHASSAAPTCVNVSCPCSRGPWVNSPCDAVWAATGTDAASSNERLDGFLAMAAVLTARYSAYAPIPLVVPKTASPVEMSQRHCQSVRRPLKTHDRVFTDGRSGVSVLPFPRPQQDPDD